MWKNEMDTVCKTPGFKSYLKSHVNIFLTLHHKMSMYEYKTASEISQLVRDSLFSGRSKQCKNRRMGDFI